MEKKIETLKGRIEYVLGFFGGGNPDKISIIKKSRVQANTVTNSPSGSKTKLRHLDTLDIKPMPKLRKGS